MKRDFVADMQAAKDRAADRRHKGQTVGKAHASWKRGKPEREHRINKLSISRAMHLAALAKITFHNPADVAQAIAEFCQRTPAECRAGNIETIPF